MHRLLQDIINTENITIEFQGIYDLNAKTVLGFEALCHGPSESQLYQTTDLIETASRCGVLFELDALYRRKAFERFSQLKLTGSLFLNINPMLLANPKYPQGQLLSLSKQWGLRTNQVVVEIDENHSIIASPVLHRVLQQYRNHGFKVALDNVGNGYNAFKYWPHIQPDIIKIEPSYAQGAQQNKAKLAFLDMLANLGKTSNTKVIAQGVQNSQHIGLLDSLGISKAQGQLLSNPSTAPTNNFPSIESVTTVVPVSTATLNNNNTVNLLLTYPPTCDKDTKTGEVYKMLVANPKLQCVPILSDDKAIGLVSRYQIMERFSNTYAHALFASKPIMQFMDPDPLILDKATSLDQASSFITERNSQQFSQYFVVTNNNKYQGLASSRDLLKHITENKIEYARYANPLTLLPGNVPIDKQIDNLLSNQLPFQLAYIDIDNFKPFNDVYGYAKGDQLIKLVAQTMQKQCKGHNTFVGHIGGDDFIILFSDDKSQSICQSIIEHFARQSLQFFDQQAINKNGYYATNRSGERTLYPLVSLSIAVVTPNIKSCHSHHDVSAMASDAKKEAKKIIGNSLFYCRRHSAEKQQSLVLKTA